jgi:putative PIN family toxin of toxin-antitoxin system
MGEAVKKTISLPPDLAADAERIAREEGKTLSADIQDALRAARRQRLRGEWKSAQGYWSASALLFPGGRADSAVVRILDGGDDLVISRPIIEEVLAVLAAKFSRDREELSRVAVLLAEMGETVEPTTRLDVFRNEPDNRILECAVEGRVDAIVTGDKAMLAIGEYEGIRLITLADYLKRGGLRKPTIY